MAASPPCCPRPLMLLSTVVLVVLVVLSSPILEAQSISGILTGRNFSLAEC
jgi:hypothetical protein